jgi:hypothetical protein
MSSCLEHCFRRSWHGSPRVEVFEIDLVGDHLLDLGGEIVPIDELADSSTTMVFTSVETLAEWYGTIRANFFAVRPVFFDLHSDEL